MKKKQNRKMRIPRKKMKIRKNLKEPEEIHKLME